MSSIAFILCGGNAKQTLACLGNRFTDYSELAKTIGPRIQRAGIDRVWLHNPGGLYAKGYAQTDPNDFYGEDAQAAWKRGIDAREMWVDQWVHAESCCAPFANREELALLHQLLTVDYGVREVVYYVGSPQTLRDADLTGLHYLAPFIALGPKASIGFDSLAFKPAYPQIRPWTKGDDICRLIAKLRKAGHKVYVEPRFTPELVATGLGKLIDGTMAKLEFDVGPLSQPLEIQPGETICLANQGVRLLEGMTHLIRHPKNWERD